MFEAFNGIEKLREKIRAIDRIQSVQSLDQIVNDCLVEQPIGPLYAIYKRTPAGCNKRVLWNLTIDEAHRLCSTLNKKVAKKRDDLMIDRHKQGLEYIPDASDLVLYDIVECDSEQENPYWNPKQLLTEN